MTTVLMILLSYLVVNAVLNMVIGLMLGITGHQMNLPEADAFLRHMALGPSLGYFLIPFWIKGIGVIACVMGAILVSAMIRR